MNTIWQLKKEAEEASFDLQLTKASMVGFIDLVEVDIRTALARSSVIASVRIGFDVRVRRGSAWVTLHRQESKAALIGVIKTSPEGFTIPSWEAEVAPSGGADTELFHAGPIFDLDRAFGSSSIELLKRQVAILRLRETIPVSLDLSGVGIDEEFQIVARAGIQGINAYNPEGGSVAYLRDPGEFDPGEQPELAGASIVGMSGVTVLAVDDAEPSTLFSGGFTALPSCDDPDAEPAVLEFSQDEYVFGEWGVANDLINVLVTRSGGLAGDVGATVTATGGTAEVGEDFTTDEATIRFGDQSEAPRPLDIGLIDDALEEDDESFTITLHSPEGCAEIGPQGTATVTILANDPSPGEVSFAADAIEFDESAGEALLEVQRIGGDAGPLIAAVATIDGTAIAGTDYVGTSETVVWSDGDAEPKVVRIPLIDDVVLDGDKIFTAELSADDPDLVGVPSTIAVTVRDDDVAPSSRFQMGATGYSVDETAGSVVVEVLRLDSAAGPASVQLSTSSDTATAGSDYVELATGVEFADGDNAPKTVTVTILDDGDLEGDHRFTIELGNPVNGVLGIPDSAVVTIIDDEGVTVPPPAPILDVAAELGEFDFNWSGVFEATYYRLLESADGIAPFVQVGADFPAGQVSHRLPIAVHLIDWSAARFRLQACNSAGCTDSNEVSVAHAMLGSIGFFKASNTSADDGFGNAVDVSTDGGTIAIAAHKEDSDAVLMNGDQGNDDAVDAGAVYVYSRGMDGWFQQAYVKAPNTHDIMEFGSSLALSADGNRLVVGAISETGSARGVDGEMIQTTDMSGAAYIYERTGGVWTFSTYLKASNTGRNDMFGHAVAMSDDGNTIIVSAVEEDNVATGINPLDQEDNSALESGAVYVFEFDGSNWVQSAYVKASNAEARDRFGQALAISGDGARFAVSAVGEDSAATGVNGDQSDNSAPGAGFRTVGTGAAYTFVRDSGVWRQEAYFKASNTDEDDQFGAGLALNYDGTVLAIGASREDSAGTNAQSLLEQDDSAPDAGAAYVFVRAAGIWAQESYLKASNTARANQFGAALDLSADGALLVVGAPLENSLAVGINGPEDQESFSPGVGAVYAYERDLVTMTWRKRSYIKATNSDESSFCRWGGLLSFGHDVALSGDSAELAVTGYYDSSDATGIGGDPVNENALRSGAAFLY